MGVTICKCKNESSYTISHDSLKTEKRDSIYRYNSLDNKNGALLF
jgi:hypothetical protein